MQEKFPENNNEAPQEDLRSAGDRLGEEETFDAVDPKTGLVKHYRNKGEYMEDIQSNDPHNP